MLLEETAAHGDVHEVRCVAHDVLKALTESLAGLRVVDALAEQLHEKVERVLVHGADVREVRDDKVEDGAADGGWSVLLAGLVDGRLRLLSLLDAAVDHRGRGLGRLQRLDQVDVVEDVPLGLLQ